MMEIPYHQHELEVVKLIRMGISLNNLKKYRYVYMCNSINILNDMKIFFHVKVRWLYGSKN